MEHRNFKLAALALVGLMAAAPLAAEKELNATDVQDSMEDLRASLGTLAAQTNALSSKVDGLLKFSGDTRVRYENVQDRSGANELYAERYRFRLRLNADAKISDGLTARARLASDTQLKSNVTTPEGDPISTNQTMGDFGADKPVYIDVAEIDYAPSVLLHPEVRAGKMYTPFTVVPGEFIFDADLTPEGFYAGINQTLFSGFNLGIKAAQFENTNGSASVLNAKFEGEQLVASYELIGKAKLTVTGAYNNFMNTNGATAVVNTQVSTNTNSAGAQFWVDNYTADVQSSLLGLGVEVYYDYAYNAFLSKDNTGYLVGATLSSGKLIPLDTDYLTLSYNYRVIQKDALFSPWSFSDFAGGGTDAAGSVTSLAVKALPGLTLTGTYFGNIKGLDAIAAGTGQGSLYERYQVDAQVKF